MDSPNEILGDVDGPVNMSEVGISVDIPYWAQRPLPVSYTLLNSNMKVLAKRDCFQQSWILFGGGLSSGKYTIVAKQGNDIQLSRNFVVTR